MVPKKWRKRVSPEFKATKTELGVIGRRLSVRGQLGLGGGECWWKVQCNDSLCAVCAGLSSTLKPAVLF